MILLLLNGYHFMRGKKKSPSARLYEMYYYQLKPQEKDTLFCLIINRGVVITVVVHTSPQELFSVIKISDLVIIYCGFENQVLSLKSVVIIWDECYDRKQPLS